MAGSVIYLYEQGEVYNQIKWTKKIPGDDDSFCRYIIQQDIKGIALDLRETHRDDFFSVPEDNPLKGLLQVVDEAASPDSDPENASLVFICKRLRLNYGKLSGEDKAALKRLAGESDLQKNPIP